LQRLGDPRELTLATKPNFALQFPQSVAAHDPRQVFYVETDGLQWRSRPS
jgi:hypothetical protein